MRLQLATSQRTSHELRILVQSVVVFLYATLLITMWHYSDRILPPAWQGDDAIAVINTAWILFSWLTPALNLIMNRYFTKSIFLIRGTNSENFGAKSSWTCNVRA